MKTPRHVEVPMRRGKSASCFVGLPRPKLEHATNTPIGFGEYRAESSGTITTPTSGIRRMFRTGGRRWFVRTDRAQVRGILQDDTFSFCMRDCGRSAAASDEHHVGRLQVAVDDARAVGRREGRRTQELDMATWAHQDSQLYIAIYA